MEIIHNISQLNQRVNEIKEKKLSIGLVPTMGALHAGHTSLIQCSIAECDQTIVSIFVNPTQFNDPKDLQNYPRTFDEDCKLIDTIGECIIFAPSIAEIYPQEDKRIFNYPPIDTVMEGARRPGHFNGVCQIVSKLFDLTQPDRAYFGEKDFQQIAVIRAMMKHLGYSFKLVSCPIIREKNGLAMSSRNKLLTPTEVAIAANISYQLFQSVARVQEYPNINTVSIEQERVIRAINANEQLKVEYFDIVDADTLQPVSNWNEAQAIQGCITVFCGQRSIRLIDNIKYK